jgi:hypothetical protein
VRDGLDLTVGWPECPLVLEARDHLTQVELTVGHADPRDVWAVPLDADQARELGTWLLAWTRECPGD